MLLAIIDKQVKKILTVLFLFESQRYEIASFTDGLETVTKNGNRKCTHL